MSTDIQEINEIIAICDAMIDFIKKNGVIIPGNNEYEEYKKRISSFLRSHDLMQEDYAPYQVLDKLYFGQNRKWYTVCLSEAQMIRKTVIDLKHELFPNLFERIFISHREKDAEQVTAFVDLLYAIGIPRPTVSNVHNLIFCTSHPASYIENGTRNLDEIKSHFNSHSHTFFILWYTDHYFESQACMNEAGAIWAMNKKYQEILAPGFESSKIGGLLDKQPVWFRATDKYRLNTFKQQIEAMFCLDPLTQNAWEEARDKYISKIESTTGGTRHADA